MTTGGQVAAAIGGVVVVGVLALFAGRSSSAPSGGGKRAPTGVTVYRGLTNASATVAMAVAAKVGYIRITDFLTFAGVPTQAEWTNAAAWGRVDALLAEASKHGILCILGLADMRNALLNHGINPYNNAAIATYWRPFILFVAQRYGKDARIFYMAPCGEDKPPSAANNLYTEQDLLSFYTTISQLWKANATVKFCTGGMGYLDFGTLWPDVFQHVFALDTVDMVGFKTYPPSALQAPSTTSGMLGFVLSPDATKGAAYCRSIGKPWLNEEFGWPQEVGDDNRAAYMRTVYEKCRAAGAVVVIQWNMGNELAPQSYDVNPQTPAAWAELQAAAAL